MIRVILSSLILFISAGTSAASDEEKLISRISPPGSVCQVGDACAGSASVASTGAGGAQSPEQVYNTYCMACHGTGANNAPVLGNATDWQPRIDKGMDTLYENAINGFNNNAMPAKGLCMSCSGDDIRATVDYILSSVQ